MSIFPSSMPYDDLKIIDQSSYVEETPVESPYIPDGPILFAPFISPRGYGEDNELKYMSASQLAKYGNPNLKKYGLSLYLAKRFIEGGGNVVGMRVTTDAYRYANFAVIANISSGVTQSKFITRTNTINNLTTYHPVFKQYTITELEEDYTVKTKTSDDYEYSFDTVIYIDSNGNSAPPVPETSSSPTGEIRKFADINTKTLFTDDQIVELSVNGEVKKFAYNYGSPSTVASKGTFTEVEQSDDSYIPKVNGKLYELYVNSSAVSVKYDIANIVDTTGSNPSEFAKDDSTISAKLTTADYYAEDASGNVTKVPLFYVRAKGAGTFGNAFKARFSIDQSMNSYINTTNGEAFCYKFIDSDNGAALDNNISFTFSDDYMYQGEPMSISEVFEKYTDNVKVCTITKSGKTITTIEQFYNRIKDLIVNTAAEVNPDKWNDSVYKIDVLFGSNIDTDIYFVDTVSGKNLSQSTGFNFAGGAEDADSKTFTFTNDIYASALASAYNGEKTDLIYDHVRFPYEFLFAPSSNSDLVDAIKNLALVNRHCTRASFFVTDSNSVNAVPADYSTARAIVKDMGVNNWKFDITPEWARITDPYTNKKVFMPSVYFTAYTYPSHWNSYRSKPLAGRQNGAMWSGFDVGTVTPRSANKDEYIQNHNVGLNTMCEDGIGYAVLYEQITSQTNTSRLSEINNAQTLCEMARIALKLANDNRWSDLGDTEINEYRTQVENAISSKLSGCYQRMEVVAVRESTNGAGRNRILCKINVLFKDMLKGVSYEFYILAS